jgi:glucose-6-phosphate isomerase
VIKEMSYTQNLEGCYIDINDNILSKALTRFRDTYKKGELSPLSLVEQTEDIALFKSAAAQFATFEHILILGTGGSSLGGQALYALSTQSKPQLHFLDNIDPFTFERVFKKIDLKKTGVLAISKSGSTVETLLQLLTCLERFESLGLKDHFMVITEPTDNPLRNLAQRQNWPCFDHPTTVGGRYSCFSIVGLLPALLAGLDGEAFRKGAWDVLNQHLTEESPPALKGAALAVHLGKPLSVMLPYADQLRLFSLWYCQLWAESLGKEGKGTTPISALGTVDQHSQLQLYLDGPKDKFLTIIAPAWKGKGDKINLSLLPEFTGKTMGDLFAAEQKATYETLIRHKCPTRLITIDRIDESTLGALMMHFMIETILASYLLNVNAFDQPAVEEGKHLARKYLAA